MDSSANTNANIVNFKQYLVGNLKLLESTLENLEQVSQKAKENLKKLVVKDGRIDNKLLEIYQFWKF